MIRELMARAQADSSAEIAIAQLAQNSLVSSELPEPYGVNDHELHTVRSTTRPGDRNYFRSSVDWRVMK